MKLTFSAYDRIGGEGSSAQRFLRDEDNQSEIAFREDARAIYMGDNSNFNSNSDFDSSSNSNSNSNSNYQEDLTSQGKFVQDLWKIFTPRHTNLLNSRGSVLIEFAVCMPILIILLFYISDLMRLKRYYSQTEFVAQQAANMIQNISQKRDNKEITLDDLKFIYVLSFQTLCPGITVFYQSKNHELGFQTTLYIHYFVGSSDGTAERKWSIRMLPPSVSTKKPQVVLSNMNINYSKYHTLFKLNQGESKIIVEPALLNNPNQKNIFGAAIAKDVFLLKLISPKETGYTASSGWSSYFNSYVTFTPKPGLFSETPPQ